MLGWANSNKVYPKGFTLQRFLLNTSFREVWFHCFCTDLIQPMQQQAAGSRILLHRLPSYLAFWKGDGYLPCISWYLLCSERIRTWIIDNDRMMIGQSPNVLKQWPCILAAKARHLQTTSNWLAADNLVRKNQHENTLRNLQGKKIMRYLCAQCLLRANYQRIPWSSTKFKLSILNK